ncbi:DUF4192 domain-containing protein, partial [Streptomyces scabiei]|nr:DUF4192 domain-containing protein [Streptomyces scabiei]
EGGIGDRAVRRSSGAPPARRARSADGSPPVGRKPGRTANVASGRARARRGTGGQSKESES